MRLIYTCLGSHRFQPAMPTVGPVTRQVHCLGW